MAKAAILLLCLCLAPVFADPHAVIAESRTWGKQKGYGAPKKGYGAPKKGYGAPKKGYGTPIGQEYGAPIHQAAPFNSYAPPAPVYAPQLPAIHEPSYSPGLDLHEPAPYVEPQVPSYGAQAPIAPAYAPPAPAYAPPAPAYAPPVPEYHAPQPTGYAPPPVHELPQSYSPPIPSFDVPELTSTYGAPEPPKSSYGAPKKLKKFSFKKNKGYGAPKAPKASYGAPKPKAPKFPKKQKGYPAPKAPKKGYGAPKKHKLPKLPELKLPKLPTLKLPSFKKGKGHGYDFEPADHYPQHGYENSPNVYPVNLVYHPPAAPYSPPVSSYGSAPEGHVPDYAPALPVPQYSHPAPVSHAHPAQAPIGYAPQPAAPQYSAPAQPVHHAHVEPAVPSYAAPAPQVAPAYSAPLSQPVPVEHHHAPQPAPVQYGAPQAAYQSAPEAHHHHHAEPAPQQGYEAAPVAQPAYGAAFDGQQGYGAGPVAQQTYAAAPAPVQQSYNTAPVYGGAQEAQQGYGAAPIAQPTYAAAPAPVQSAYEAAPSPAQATYNTEYAGQQGYEAAPVAQPAYGAAFDGQQGYGAGPVAQQTYAAAPAPVQQSYNTAPVYGGAQEAQQGYGAAPIAQPTYAAATAPVQSAYEAAPSPAQATYNTEYAGQQGYEAAPAALSAYGSTQEAEQGYGAAPVAQQTYAAATAPVQQSYDAAPAYGAAPEAQQGYGVAPVQQQTYAAGPTPVQSAYEVAPGPVQAAQSAYGAAQQESYGAAPPQAQQAYEAAPVAQQSYEVAPAPQQSYEAAPFAQPTYQTAPVQPSYEAAQAPALEQSNGAYFDVRDTAPSYSPAALPQAQGSYHGQPALQQIPQQALAQQGFSQQAFAQQAQYGQQAQIAQAQQAQFAQEQQAQFNQAQQAQFALTQQSQFAQGQNAQFQQPQFIEQAQQPAVQQQSFQQFNGISSQQTPPELLPSPPSELVPITSFDHSAIDCATCDSNPWVPVEGEPIRGGKEIEVAAIQPIVNNVVEETEAVQQESESFGQQIVETAPATEAPFFEKPIVPLPQVPQEITETQQYQETVAATFAPAVQQEQVFPSFPQEQPTVVQQQQTIIQQQQTFGQQQEVYNQEQQNNQQFFEQATSAPIQQFIQETAAPTQRPEYFNPPAPQPPQVLAVEQPSFLSQEVQPVQQPIEEFLPAEDYLPPPTVRPAPATPEVVAPPEEEYLPPPTAELPQFQQTLPQFSPEVPQVEEEYLPPPLPQSTAPPTTLQTAPPTVAPQPEFFQPAESFPENVAATNEYFIPELDYLPPPSNNRPEPTRNTFFPQEEEPQRSPFSEIADIRNKQTEQEEVALFFSTVSPVANAEQQDYVLPQTSAPVFTRTQPEAPSSFNEEVRTSGSNVPFGTRLNEFPAVTATSGTAPFGSPESIENSLPDEGPTRGDLPNQPVKNSNSDSDFFAPQKNSPVEVFLNPNQPGKDFEAPSDSASPSAFQRPAFRPVSNFQNVPVGQPFLTSNNLPNDAPEPVGDLTIFKIGNNKNPSKLSLPPFSRPSPNFANSFSNSEANSNAGSRPELKEGSLDLFNTIGTESDNRPLSSNSFSAPSVFDNNPPTSSNIPNANRDSDSLTSKEQLPPINSPVFQNNFIQSNENVNEFSSFQSVSDNNAATPNVNSQISVFEQKNFSDKNDVNPPESSVFATFESDNPNKKESSSVPLSLPNTVVSDNPPVLNTLNPKFEQSTSVQPTPVIPKLGENTFPPINPVNQITQNSFSSSQSGINNPVFQSSVKTPSGSKRIVKKKKKVNSISSGSASSVRITDASSTRFVQPSEPLQTRLPSLTGVSPIPPRNFIVQQPVDEDYLKNFPEIAAPEGADVPDDEFAAIKSQLYELKKGGK
ncbi:titin-like isoform X2 [Artemia franciscana]|uniref:titin-like isoform X2 n=1 Tax=Artemia franciscana TaxID=6661 RepID=UPI0032DBE357